MAGYTGLTVWGLLFKAVGGFSVEICTRPGNLGAGVM